VYDTSLYLLEHEHIDVQIRFIQAYNLIALRMTKNLAHGKCISGTY